MGVYGNGFLELLMPSLKRKIMREYTRVTYSNAEISERDTEFRECWGNPVHAQTVCTRPSLLVEGLGTRLACMYHGPRRALCFSRPNPTPRTSAATRLFAFATSCPAQQGKAMCSPVYLLMLPVCEKLALLTGIHRVGLCPIE